MKHLKLFESFKEEDINDICQKYDIENYTINEDGSIDVNGNVNLTSKDRIFLVAMDVPGIERDKDIEDKFYYAVFPAESELRSSTMHLNGTEKERLLSADEWQQQISANGDSYVYLQTVSADFAARYGSLFERVSDIGNGRVYKVSYGGNDKMVLKLLGK